MTQPACNDLTNEVNLFLKANPDVLRDDYELVKKLCLEKKANFPGQNADSITPVPHFIESEKYQYLCEMSEKVFNAFERVVENYFTDIRIRQFYPHLEKYQRLVSLPVRQTPVITMARFDIIESIDGQYKIIEPNASAPGFTLLLPIMDEVLRQTQLHRWISERYDLVPTPIHDKQTVFNCLVLEHKKIFGPKNKYKVLIAYTNYQTRFASHDHYLKMVKVYSEHMIQVAEYCGIDIEIAPIQEIRFVNGAPIFNAKPFDIVYHFLDISFSNETANIAANFNEIESFLEGIIKSAFLLVNPFASCLIADKSLLALVRDPNFHYLFSEDELRAIDQLIPETFIISNSTVTFQNEKLNLIKMLKSQKDSFVIKAQMGREGRDVIIGHQTSKEEWEREVDASIDAQVIAQRLVTPRKYQIGKPDGTYELMNHSLGMYMMAGKAKGMVNRVSPDSIVNISRGGTCQLVQPFRLKKSD